jgi:hypothetical protein
MISEKNKDILINKLRLGHSIIEACELSQISKATLYRHLKDPQFKAIFDEAIFYANSKIDIAKEKLQKETDEKNWAELKKIALRKRD